MKVPRWKDEPARAQLLALYAEVDARLSALTCDASADCCHFARTGREPYPTAVEAAEVEEAIAQAGGIGAFGVAKGRSGKLPILGEERRCPLLSQEGKCRIYAARPFGCRTFFCDRVQGGRVPRDVAQEIGRRIADLSARTFDRDPGPRTLESALERLQRGESFRATRRFA